MGLVDFPGHNGLLLVAAGHAPGDGYRALAGAYVILPDELFRILPDCVKFDHTVVMKFWIPVPLKHQVLLQGVVQDQAVLMPVLGNVAHAGFAPGPGGVVGDVPATEGEGTGRLPGQAGEAIDKFCLPVALDPGQADDLPLANLEGHIPDGVLFVHLGGD